MDELIENSKSKNNYFLYCIYICFAIFFVYLVFIGPYLTNERQKKEKIIEIEKANTYQELGRFLETLNVKDSKDEYIITEIKKKNTHKELLSEYIQSTCTTSINFSALCRDPEKLNSILSTFNIILPNNDKYLAWYFKSIARDSLSLSKIFEYEVIVSQYKKLFKIGFEYSSKNEGVELLSLLKIDLNKQGLHLAEYQFLKNRLENTCSSLPSNYLLLPFCEEPSSTWDDALLIGFKNEIYHSVKNEGASERAETLRTIHEQLDEIKKSSNNKNLIGKITEMQGLAQSKMPSGFEIQQDNIREAIHNQAEAIRIQGMIQQQEQYQKNKN